MNKVILIGRLTKDPEIREGNTKVARYTIAVDRYKDGADFISCVAFDKKADFAEKYMTKGHKFAISGRLQTGSYTNKEGKKVYTTDVIVDEQEFVEPKETKDNDGFITVPEGIADDLPFA